VRYFFEAGLALKFGGADPLFADCSERRKQMKRGFLGNFVRFHGKAHPIGGFLGKPAIPLSKNFPLSMRQATLFYHHSLYSRRTMIYVFWSPNLRCSRNVFPLSFFAFPPSFIGALIDFIIPWATCQQKIYENFELFLKIFGNLYYTNVKC
jgi:hypothetical protein